MKSLQYISNLKSMKRELSSIIGEGWFYFEFYFYKKKYAKIYFKQFKFINYHYLYYFGS